MRHAGGTAVSFLSLRCRVRVPVEKGSEFAQVYACRLPALADQRLPWPWTFYGVHSYCSDASDSEAIVRVCEWTTRFKVTAIGPLNLPAGM